MKTRTVHIAELWNGAIKVLNPEMFTKPIFQTKKDCFVNIYYHNDNNLKERVLDEVVKTENFDIHKSGPRKQLASMEKFIQEFYEFKPFFEKVKKLTETNSVAANLLNYYTIDENRMLENLKTYEPIITCRDNFLEIINQGNMVQYFVLKNYNMQKGFGNMGKSRFVNLNRRELNSQMAENVREFIGELYRGK